MKIVQLIKQCRVLHLAIVLTSMLMAGLALGWGPGVNPPTIPIPPVIGPPLIPPPHPPPSDHLTLADMAKNIGRTIASVSWILSDISIIFGIGFVLASFPKFHQHRQNPQQITMGQPLTLLFIGALLLLFPAFIPVATDALMKRGPTHLGGGELNQLIGGPTAANN